MLIGLVYVTIEIPGFHWPILCNNSNVRLLFFGFFFFEYSLQQWKCQRRFTGPFFVTIEVSDFYLTVLCSNGNVSGPFEAITLSTLQGYFKKIFFSFLGNKYLDSLATPWSLRCPRLLAPHTISQFLPMTASYNPFRRIFFPLYFTGYQPVLSGQQGFQGMMGVQQSAHSQGVMSSQQGAPVHGVMVSYPTMSSYQVCASSSRVWV